MRERNAYVLCNQVLLFALSVSLEAIIIMLQPGPQRENFPGGTKVDTGPPQASSGPMLLNHFLSDWCRSSFKSEGTTIFAYSWDL